MLLARVFRLGIHWQIFWLGSFFIVVASLAPAAYRPRSYLLTGPQEHMIAYAALGFAVAACTKSHVAALLGLLALAAGVELLQHFTPDRNSSLIDFIHGSVGAIASLMLVKSIRSFSRQFETGRVNRMLPAVSAAADDTTQSLA